MDPYKNPWPEYTPPRNIVNFDSPWVPSPDLVKHNAAVFGAKHNLVELCPATPHGPQSMAAGRNIGRLFRQLCRSKLQPSEPAVENNWAQTPFSNTSRVPFSVIITHVPQSEWRAFAAYSRPTINGVDVHNTFTPSPTPYRTIDLEDEVDLQEVFNSLRSPSGEIHPERWIRGLQHPSLPPPPTAWWTLPSPGEPLAFPWECELNPFLKPAVSGPAPVYWNIRAGTLAIFYGGPNDVTIQLSAPDLAQPATHPLVTHMYISAVACMDAGFPWKFMVVNPAGIRVRDVFNAINDNFQHFVSISEHEKWTFERQQRAELEYKLRKGEHGLRRLDYLCGQLCFRGLEPNPDRTGWVFYVGSEW
ncbi:hypothetical protein B0H19DRAFT_579221 [Mycena capillaripes]|nr:hypothetical protein B0H19DRAFT_579221 [Mycena capillaripes]